MEELFLENLQDRHGVKRRGRLSSRWIGSSRESRTEVVLHGLDRFSGFCFPVIGCGRAEMRGNWLIQWRQAAVTFFSAPSTEMRAEEEESRRWDELGACQDLVISKSGRKRGAGLLSEKKVSRERREEKLISPQWWHSVLVKLFQRWRRPSVKHTCRVFQWCAGEPCTSDKSGGALATTPRHLLFYRGFS